MPEKRPKKSLGYTEEDFFLAEIAQFWLFLCVQSSFDAQGLRKCIFEVSLQLHTPLKAHFQEGVQVKFRETNHQKSDIINIGLCVQT